MALPRLAHIQLNVRNLQHAVDFYTHYLNLAVTETIADQVVFLSNDQRHHVLALVPVSKLALPQGLHAVGMLHMAFEVDHSRDLAFIFRELWENHIEVIAKDHGVSWSIYFADPDGNGIEVFCDLRQDVNELWGGMSESIPPQQLLDLATR